MGEISFYSILVFLFTFLLRYIFCPLKENVSLVSDALVHKYFVKSFTEKDKKFLFVDDKRFLSGSLSPYPPILYYLISKIIGIKFLKYDKLFNPFIDALFNMILFVYAFDFFRVSGFSNIDIYIASFIVCLFYVFTPLFYYLTEKTSSFTGRTFNYHLGMFNIMCTVQYLNTHSTYWFLGIVFFSIFIVYSSQFDLQMLILFQSLASVFTFNIYPFFSLLLGLGISYLLYPKWISFFCVRKYRHIKWYYRMLRKKEISLVSRYRKFWSNFLIWIFPFVFIITFNNVYSVSSASFYLFVYALISILVTLFIWIPLFRPFGEAYRYLEFGLPYIYMLFVYTCFVSVDLMSYRYLILFFVLFLNFCLLVRYFCINLMPERSDNAVFEELIVFLNSLDERVILPIPLKGSYAIALRSKHKILSDIFVASDSVSKFCEKYLCPKRDLSALRREYGFDTIVYGKKYNILKIPYDFSEFIIIYQNKEYVVFEVRK